MFSKKVSTNVQKMSVIKKDEVVDKKEIKNSLDSKYTELALHKKDDIISRKIGIETAKKSESFVERLLFKYEEVKEEQENS